MKIARCLLILLVVTICAAPTFAQRSKRRTPAKRPVAAKTPAPIPQAGVTTASGLTTVFIHRANGKKPTVGQTVLVHYTGTLVDGTKFDSSFDRKEPIAFPLGKGRVIKGWDEGIAQLGVGDKAVLIIPPSIGYGERGAGGVIPPNATLVFFVELVEVRGEALSSVLMQLIETKGIDAALAEYHRMKREGFGDVFVNEGDLNGLGYALMGKGKMAEAIAIFVLIVDAWPQSANAYDSLGEAHARAGNKDKAIENYQRCVDLDPANTNAVEMLKRLKGQ